MKFITIVCCCVVSSGFCQDLSDQTRIHNNFSLQIYRSTVAENENLFISPLSIRVALLAASAGARGDTKKQYDAIVGNFDDAKQFLSEISGMSDQLDLFGPRNKLEIANSVWTNNSIHIKDEFIKTLRNNFSSEQFGFNPKDPRQAQDEVNNWVSEKTHGRITNMPGPGEHDACVIINAIYFFDKWQRRFKVKQTKPRTFHDTNGSKQDFPTMHSHDEYLYFENAELQALTLYYESQLEMIVLLPRRNDGIKGLEKMLDNTLVQQVAHSSNPHPVDVFLPKFKLRSEIGLPSGVDDPLDPLFSATADYSGIAEPSPGIGGVIHKTFIEIDEKKTEAAAVSEIAITTGRGGELPPPPEPKVFRADHPFMFLIVDKMYGGIVFAGRFVKPEND